MTCQECGGSITGTPYECQALTDGLRLCQSCLESIDDEAEAYERMRCEEV